MPDPLISLILSFLFIAIILFLFWPEQGLFFRIKKLRRLSTRILTEDALKHIHHCEMGGRRPTVESLAGSLHIPVGQATDLLTRLQIHGLTQMVQDQFRLTPEGREYALRIIRAHRLWERYLADETGYPESDWHDQAEVYEHHITESQAKDLANQLGNPTHDPHGDPIPTPKGDYTPHGGEPLTRLPTDQPARIVHIEDEPDAVYAQIVAEDLHPGMELRVIESTPQRVRFWANGDEHLLAPMVATNISVTPLPKVEIVESVSDVRLSNLVPGQRGRVIKISPAVRGPERRRLMDLGILPGTIIEAELSSPSGDPVGYRVRGALIALREEQAGMICIESIQESNP